MARKTNTNKTDTIEAQAAEALTQAPEQVTLANMCVSPLNPRRVSNPDEVADLVASIEALGLMQPLCGLRVSGVHTEIVAGGRRLRALQEVARRSGISPEAFTVPVTVTHDPNIARAWAGAENIVRQPLSPAQEVKAFGAMVKTGMDVEGISNAFGVSQRHVEGRLSLAKLPKTILQALEAGEITFDLAKAYTLADDPAAAEEVFNRMNGTYDHRPYTVRKALTAQMTEADNRVARFVGEAAYRAAGGTVTSDLFEEDIYFDDPALVSTLALDKLKTRSAELLAEGWAWVDISIEHPDYDMLQKLGRTYPQQVECSEEEAQRYDELAESEELTHEEDAEFEALQAKLDRETFSDAQKSLSGVLLTIGFDGHAFEHSGYVRDAERHKAIEAGMLRESAHLARSGGSEGATAAKYPKALCEDLDALRTASVQAALLAKPELALDILTFHLTHRVYAGSGIMDGTAHLPTNTVKADEGHDLPDRLGRQERRGLMAESAADAFAAFRAQPKRERNAALTEAIAQLVGVSMDSSANPLAKAVADLVKPDLRSQWTPTASFLKRLKAAQLDQITAHIDGVGCGSTWMGMKKGQKVAHLAKVFAGNADVVLSKDQRARADAWVPEDMEPVEVPESDDEAGEPVDVVAIAAE